jgi:hypothetical protein
MPKTPPMRDIRSGTLFDIRVTVSVDMSLT